MVRDTRKGKLNVAIAKLSNNLHPVNIFFVIKINMVKFKDVSK